MNGIKSLAQQGRYGDTMLAHINPQEAGILKALGGSGTINPNTGLPEYFNPIKFAKKTLSRLDDVVLQPVTGRIQDAVQAVAKATGPVGQMAATYYGGPLGAALYGGLAGEDGFNFKRGLMSGALAYGAQGLAEGVGAAGGAAPPPVPDPTAQIASELGANAATGAGSQAAMLANQAAAFGDAGISNIASGASYANPMQLGVPGTDLAAGEIAKTGLSEPSPSFMDRVGSSIRGAYDSATNPSTYKDIGSNIADKTTSIPDKLANLSKGAYNLATNQPGAVEAFKASGATLGNTALPIMMGTAGIAAIDEQERIKKQQEEELAAFNERVKRGVASATEAMQLNPYRFAAGGDVNYSMDDYGYAESGLGNLRNGVHFAAGGDVSPDTIKAQLMAGKEPSMYEMRNMNVPDVIGGTGPKGYMAQTNFGKDIPLGEDAMLTLLASGKLTPDQGAKLSKYGIGALKKFKDSELSGYAEKNDETGEKRYGAKFTKRFNEGGMPPRFLSGGGDGMSDSIKATIDNKQPARLADGEFVIPADVVSHLGNGSSKAGAKRLYSMMDEVRHARTGNKKQGRQINPNKFLPK